MTKHIWIFNRTVRNYNDTSDVSIYKCNGCNTEAYVSFSDYLNYNLNYIELDNHHPIIWDGARGRGRYYVEEINQDCKAIQLEKLLK